MKFGKTLRRLINPDWSPYYINYKQLKQYIQPTPCDIDTNHNELFVQAINNEINKINTFFLTELSSNHSQFIEFIHSIQNSIINQSDISNSTIQQLGQYVHTYDRLRSYVSLNQLGFSKVLKKFDKYNYECPLKSTVMNQLIPYELYSTNELANKMVQCNMIIALLSAKAQYSVLLQSNHISILSSHDYNCAVCMNILYEPVVLTCAHTFCHRCINKSHQQSVQPCCPTCRRPVYINDTTYDIHHELHIFIQRQYTNEYNTMCKERSTIPNTPPLTAQTPNTNQSRSTTPSPTKQITNALNDTHMSTQVLNGLDDLQLPPTNPATNNTNDLVAETNVAPTELVPGPHGIYLSAHIDTLLQYKHLGSQLYCIVDIDETIHINPYKRYGCMLMTDKGLQSYQHILTHSPIYANVPIPAKNKTTRVLQSALASKQCVEIDEINRSAHVSTVDTIHQLQAAGCYVFALTARYAAQAATTHNELLALDIDFSKSTPWNNQCVLHDNDTDALYSNGVIYTSATEKGVILDRFLNGLFTTDHIGNGLQSIPIVSPPSHIVFIDDRYSNCHNVQHSCDIVKQLNIQLITFHYTYCSTDDDTQGDDIFDIELVQTQVHHFLHTNQILNDKQALALLHQYRQKQPNYADESRTAVQQSTTRTVLAC